jgi:hypothetical protein
MTHDAPAYGLWMLGILNSAIFIIFAFSFGKPQSPRDWRSFGAFGVEYERYAAVTPAWFPRLAGRGAAGPRPGDAAGR